VEGALYIPRLSYLDRKHNVFDLRLRGRTPADEHWPKEIQDCLRRLERSVGEGQLADTENEERIAAENALTFLHEAQTAFDKHDLPEPKLLVQLQIDLTKVRNELDPDQFHGRSEGRS
jgi:hypothetical protein